MGKHLLCLCLFLLTWSNAYAWYCSYTPTTSGYISNLQCTGIDPTLAVKDYWCPYRNADPICRQFDQPAIPVCTDTTEVQSIACQPHYSGIINQSRTHYCQTQTYSDWVTTSNNCTQDPPTCHVSSETQTLSCQVHYSGEITQTRSSTCSDPYGQATMGDWVTTSNTCVQDPPTCNPVTETQTLACGVHQHGMISQSRTSTCSDPYGQPTQGDWITTSNTCAPDPATCIASTQTRTLACQSGFKIGRAHV